jgi:predicted dehydrogenase
VHSRAVPVAVVGVGNMGRHHARNYAELPAAELRAVVDVRGHARDM